MWAAAARRTEDDPRDFIQPHFPLIFSGYFRFEIAAQADATPREGQSAFKNLFPKQIFSLVPLPPPALLRVVFTLFAMGVVFGMWGSVFISVAS